MDRVEGDKAKNLFVPAYDKIAISASLQSKDQLDFMERFSAGTGIPLEPIYTGKLFYALYDMVLNRQIPAGANVVAVHTGGLQGLRGMQPLMDKIKARVG